MGALHPDRLQVTFAPGTSADHPAFPRVYTLTHSHRPQYDVAESWGELKDYRAGRHPG